MFLEHYYLKFSPSASFQNHVFFSNRRTVKLKTLKASNNDYGLVAKLFHWVFVIVISWQLFTGIDLHGMEFSFQKGQFIWFHQITGTLMFCFIAICLIWRFYNRPQFEAALTAFHKWSSKIVQLTLYALCLWVPVQGTMMTWSRRYDVYLVGLIKIPTLIAENKAMYLTFVSFHYASSMLLLSLTGLHIPAGFYHRYITADKYSVWKRMAIKLSRSENI